MLEPSEKMRLMLLEEERRLRSKQPEHWAKSKYRKYASKMTTEEKELKKIVDAAKKSKKKPKPRAKRKKARKPKAKAKRKKAKKSSKKKTTRKRKR